MQVAFAQDDSPPALSKVIKLAGVTYNLYTQSMPHFGQVTFLGFIYSLKFNELKLDICVWDI